VIEEGEKVCIVECPIRNCRIKVDLTEFASEAYGDDFAKYKKTSILSENPFLKGQSVSLAKPKIEPNKKKGKCCVEGCEVTKGHYDKPEKCTKFCKFFICKEHWEAGCAKLKEVEYKCPGCESKLVGKEVNRYKKSKEDTPVKLLEEKEMEYDLPEDD